jgi:hypothetical protein
MIFAAPAVEAGFSVTFTSGVWTKGVNDNNTPLGLISDGDGTTRHIKFASATVDNYTVTGFEAVMIRSGGHAEVQIAYETVTRTKSSSATPLTITCSCDGFDLGDGVLTFGTSEQSSVVGAGGRSYDHTYNGNSSAIIDGTAAATRPFKLTASITFTPGGGGKFGTGVISGAGGVSTFANIIVSPAPPALALLACAAPAGLLLLRRRKAK